ncbi:hypothetical protein BKA61DRAFT_653005 [Leptodontidium sp. MPI-SDFR-AT-0119]|nr:hypothetical protein BKA61DRAFT_653005 [Leptodontidium sp. MPI-SDFR-AT-0119]
MEKAKDNPEDITNDFKEMKRLIGVILHNTLQKADAVFCTNAGSIRPASSQNFKATFAVNGEAARSSEISTIAGFGAHSSVRRHLLIYDPIQMQPHQSHVSEGKVSSDTFFQRGSISLPQRLENAGFKPIVLMRQFRCQSHLVIKFNGDAYRTLVTGTRAIYGQIDFGSSDLWDVSHYSRLHRRGLSFDAATKHAFAYFEFCSRNHAVYKYPVERAILRELCEENGCLRCKATDHKEAECTMEKPVENPFCRKCNSREHGRSECPKRKCNKCKQLGRVIDDCTASLPRKLRADGIVLQEDNNEQGTRSGRVAPQELEEVNETFDAFNAGDDNPERNFNPWGNAAEQKNTEDQQDHTPADVFTDAGGQVPGSGGDWSGSSGENNNGDDAAGDPCW